MYSAKQKLERVVIIGQLSKQIELTSPESPDFGHLLEYRGSLYLTLRQIPEAQRDFEAALVADPNQPDPLFFKGFCHLAQGDYRTAIETLDEYLALQPRNAAAFAYRAWAHYHEGDTERAMKDAKQALLLDDRCQVAYLAKGRVMQQTGRIHIGTMNVNIAHALAGISFPDTL